MNLSVNKARLIRDNAALMVRNVPILGIIYSQAGNKTFPAWEKRSHPAEKIVFLLLFAYLIVILQSI
jgi:hypothetical protein